jgi:hypothetical protein
MVAGKILKFPDNSLINRESAFGKMQEESPGGPCSRHRNGAPQSGSKYPKRCMIGAWTLQISSIRRSVSARGH